MTTATTTRTATKAAPAGAPRPRKLARVYKAPQGHWVGDGFPVRAMFSYHRQGAEVSPFLLLDYAGPAKFPPATTTARRRDASAPRLRDRDHRLPGRGRASRHRRQPGPHRPRRRAVDDGRHGRAARGNARSRVHRDGRHARDGAALGQPAGEGQDVDAALPGDPRCDDAVGCARRDGQRRARDRRRATTARKGRPTPSRRSISGTCGSTAGQHGRARCCRTAVHDDPARAAGQRCASTAARRCMQASSRSSSARASTSRSRRTPTATCW